MATYEKLKSAYKSNETRDAYNDGYKNGFNDCLDELWDKVLRPIVTILLTEEKIKPKSYQEYYNHEKSDNK